MITSEKIASQINGKLYGDKNLNILGPCDLIPGKKNHISFLDNKADISLLNKTKSDVIILDRDVKSSHFNKTFISIKNPKLVFFNFVRLNFTNDNNPQGIHNTAIISDDATIGKNVSIGPYCIIEKNVKIASGSKIYSNCYIGSDSIVGSNTIIFSNVSLYNNIKIGNNVLINSGVVIGANGFGILKDKSQSLIQIPHIGTVTVDDDVVIGSNSTIDRATMSKTVIGKGTKIDGQVHIAHNVKIGKNCIISGQSAIGGSTILGDNVVLGGQVGIIDNLVIGNNCQVAAKSAVMKSIDSNSIVSGIPAMTHSKKLRLDVLLSKLPEIVKKIKNKDK